MKKMIKIFGVLGVFALIIFAGTSTALAVPQRIGVNGLENLLEKHEGKIVIINFFATWCPPCKKEIPDLVSISRERSKDVVVIGLSLDKNPKLLPQFLRDYGVKYEVYVADREVQKLFEVRSIPHNAVFNKSGDMVANESGVVTKRELNNFIDRTLKKYPTAELDSDSDSDSDSMPIDSDSDSMPTDSNSSPGILNNFINKGLE